MATNEEDFYMFPSKLDQFKRGSILKIELSNFMIYEHVVFVPGPFLNLILGPNGSGKSAIVCSIIMGFGGDPQVTGRSSTLIDYIRFGTQTASIIIHLYSGNVNEENMKIERQLRSVLKNGKNECQTTWKLNGRTVQKNMIADFIKSLNIDINNLCQVLPQERVVEFSRLSPKELLASTEKSIGDVHMYDRHLRLVALSNDVSALQTQIKNCNAFIMKYQSYKTNIEPDLKLIKQKKKFEEEIDWLVKKKVWLDYEEKRLNYVRMKEEFVLKRNEFNFAGQSVKPIRTRIESCLALLRTLHGQKAKSSIAMKNSYSKISKHTNEIAELDKKITTEIVSFNETMDNEKRNKDKLVKLENDKRNFENELESTNDDEHFEAKVEEIRREITQIEQEINQLSNHVNAKKGKLNNLQREKMHLTGKKKQLSDTFNLRLSKISELDSSSKRACEWLENNRDMFRGQIFPPIITQVNVLKPEWVVYVEQGIGSMDLSTFLFEDNHDLQKFCEGLESATKIRVNVAMLPRNMTMYDCERNFDLNQYRQFGIFASIRDLFTAPDPVMMYLCKSYHIHKVPVGNDVTEQKIQMLMDRSDFRRIFTSKNMFSIVISIYDNVKSTRMVPLRQPRFFNVIVDEDEVKAIDEKLAAIDQECAAAEAEIDQDRRKYDKLKEDREMKRNVLKTFEQRQSAIEYLQHRIHGLDRQIDEAKKQIATVEQLKDNVADRLSNMHTAQMKALEEVSKAIKVCVNHTSSESVFVSKINLLKNLKSQYERQKAAVEAEIDFIKNEMTVLENNLKDARDAAKMSRDEAKTVTGMDFTNNSHSDDPMYDKFSALPDTMGEIDDAITVLRLRSEGIADIDDSVLEEYQKYQREIAAKTNECTRLEADLKKVEEEIQTIKPLWLDALKALIGKINDNFGKFMELMKYSGEVYLYEGNKEYAFEDYGIRIKVKFRDAEPMKDLDAYHQSGGERSVSTMVYMLSLQELANVPFRVVDEINQGMDDRNERLVFDLISEVSRRNSSQYFLLSPKLLPRLNYTREMTVHIIMNGAHVYADLFKLTKLLAKKANAEPVLSDSGAESDCQSD